MKLKWLPIETAPKQSSPILVMTDEGLDLVTYLESEEDGEDCMGHDSGWFGNFSIPGRSFGAVEYLREALNQPTHWLPIPEFEEEE